LDRGRDGVLARDERMALAFEFGSQSATWQRAASIVWQKMLTAPDSSTLEIRYKTNSIGTCRWRADVGQELATGARLSDDDSLEGMVQQLAYYSLDLEGNMTLPNFSTRVRFSFELRLDTNRMWQTFAAHVSMRPDVYELSANSAAQTVHLRVDAGADKLDRTFRFAEFQNPQKLLQEFGGPMFPAFAAALGVPLSTNKLSSTSLGPALGSPQRFAAGGTKPRARVSPANKDLRPLSHRLVCQSGR